MADVLFLDANSLKYAYEAAGNSTALLDRYAAYARAAGYELAITDVVRREILTDIKGKDHLVDWLFDKAKGNNIKIVQTDELSKLQDFAIKKKSGLPTGDYIEKNAGDRSIAESISKQQKAGGTPRVFSDDGYFNNAQELKKFGLRPGIGMTTAHMLNDAARKGVITPEEFAKFRDGYRSNAAPWKPNVNGRGSYSLKLDTFSTTEELSDILSGKATASSTHMATLFKGLKVLGAAGLIYDIGTSTVEAADATNKGDRAGAGNIMARLAGRLYLGMEGAALGAAIGGGIGAPGGPVALASSLVGALVGGIGGAFIGDAAVDALWKAADDTISLLQAGTPEAGVDTPLLQTSGKYYRGLIASGMPKQVADKLMRELNAEYKERRLEQPNASVESLIESVIQDVRSNQAIEPEDAAGANVTVIRGAQYATTVINSDSGKIETINDIKTRKPVSSELYDNQGRLIGGIQFNSDGSNVENSYDPDTGRIMTSITLYADGSSSKDTYDLRGRPTREQHYDSFGDLTSDVGSEGDITGTNVAAKDEAIRLAIESQAAAKAEAQKQAVAKAEAERQAAAKAEAERQAAVKAEADRQAAAKAEAERQAAVKAGTERQAAAKAEADRQAAAKAEAERQAAVKAEADRQAAAKAEADRQAAAKAEADRQAAVKAEADRQAAAKAEADRQAAVKAEADRQAAAKAEAERQAAERAEADRRAAAEKAERDRIAWEEAQKAQELQRQRINERLRQEEQSRRESQERQRQWQMQQQREAEQRRQQEAADQARRDTERERLQRESENAAFENMRRQGTFSNLPSSPTIFQPPQYLPFSFSMNGVKSSTPIYLKFTSPRLRPVVLDLNNDGELDIQPFSPTGMDQPKSVSSASQNENIAVVSRFDANGDSIRDEVAWIGPNDGLLVIDLGKSEATGPDGQINRPEEIAFSLWKSEEQRVAELKEKGIDDTGRPVTDLEGLRFAFDTNQDNILDSQDARWSEFRIWQDFNQNGATDEGELSTMEAEGISFIDLLPSEQGAKSFPDGSMITGTSSAKRIDGTSILVGDVALAYRPSQSGL